MFTSFAAALAAPSCRIAHVARSVPRLRASLCAPVRALLSLCACVSACPLPAALVKDAVNAAYETTLQQGIVHERRLFYSTFATVTNRAGGISGSGPAMAGSAAACSRLVDP